MDVEKGRNKCTPRIPVLGHLGYLFNCTQAIGRSLSVLFELGALVFISILHAYWKDEPTTRVDILVPAFPPVVVGILVDTYEVVSLLFLRRQRAISPLIVCLDIVMIGVGIFSFLVLSWVDRGLGEIRAVWATDMTNAMIFMIVFSLLHAAFLILAVGGIVHSHMASRKKSKDAQLAKNRAALVQFYQRRQQASSQPRIG